jgi:hypothetical protein
MGYLRRKEGRGFDYIMLPILPESFWSIFIRGWGKNVILTCEWVRGMCPFFFGLFLFCCGVQSKRTSRDTRHHLTNFAGVSAQEEPPVPRNPPTQTSSSHQSHINTHKPTNKQTKNLTCKRNSRLAFFFCLHSSQQECKLRGLFP